MLYNWRSIAAATAVAFTAAGAAHHATAQDYPDSPVRVVIPAAAGGGSDLLGRYFSAQLEEVLGVPFVPVNVPGGGQIIGNLEVRNAEPDGYTMTITHAAMIIAEALGNAEFGAGDFEPVAQVARQNLLIVVDADSEFGDLDDLIEAASDGEDPVQFGVNIGGINHFGPLLLEQASGADFRYVQTGGSGPTIAALLGGHVDAAALSTASVASYLESGDLRALAVLSEEQDSFVPDIPISAEFGYPVDFQANTWFLMPAGTPEDRVAIIADAIQVIMASDETRSMYQERQLHPVFLSGEELRASIEATEASIFEIVESNNLAEGQ